MPFFTFPTIGKKHKYKTQKDLQGMSAEQIINLDPTKVHHKISENDGGRPLKGIEINAMNTLLAIKRLTKGRPDLYRKVVSVLSNSGPEEVPNTEIDDLIHKTEEEMEYEDITKRLDNMEEDDITERLKNLGGKRKGKTVSKRKRRGKTRKGRKTK